MPAGAPDPFPRATAQLQGGPALSINAPLQLFSHPQLSAVPKPAAYRVSVAGGYTLVSTPSLPFALAQARATALRGYPVWLHD